MFATKQNKIDKCNLKKEIANVYKRKNENVNINGINYAGLKWIENSTGLKIATQNGFGLWRCKFKSIQITNLICGPILALSSK